MTAQELEATVRAALNAGGAFPWWSHAAIIAFSFIGGFLGAYMKKIGENLAMRAEFDTLLGQVKQTTEATENIKLELAGHNWLSQQQWQLREKYYADILETLFKLKITLEERAGYFREPDSAHDEKRIQTRHFQDQVYLGAEAFEKLQRLSGPAGIVISSDAIQALEQLGREHWRLKESDSSSSEYVRLFLDYVNAVYGRVPEEAKYELCGGGKPFRKDLRQ